MSACDFRVFARLADHGERALGLLRRHLVQRVADMDQHVVARRHVFEERCRDFLLYRPESDNGVFSVLVDGKRPGREARDTWN